MKTFAQFLSEARHTIRNANQKIKVGDTIAWSGPGDSQEVGEVLSKEKGGKIVVKMMTGPRKGKEGELYGTDVIAIERDGKQIEGSILK